MEWRTRYWDDSEVNQLLALWGDERVQRELDGTRRDNQVFIKLSEDLRGRGILRSPAQVREKIKILKREYRLCLGRLEQQQPGSLSLLSGACGSTTKFKYFEQMCDIMGSHRPPVGSQVQAVSGHSGGSLLRGNNSPETKPLDLHVMRMSRNVHPDGNRVEVKVETKKRDHREAFGSHYHSHNSAVKDNPNGCLEVTDRLTSESSDSCFSERRRWEDERANSSNTNKHPKPEQNGHSSNVSNLSDIMKFLEDFKERFFRLEEARIVHEKELEATRIQSENRLWEKLNELATTNRCCCKNNTND